MVDWQAQSIMNNIEPKTENLRKARRKLAHTWSEIVPRITVTGLVVETFGQLMKKHRSDALVTAVAVAGAAWLFNTFKVSRNVYKFPKAKIATLKTGD